MNKLETIVTNPFSTIDVSRARIQQFIYDHIQRMIAANNPALAQLIADTTALWEALFGSIEDYKDYINQQVGLTRQVKTITAEFTTKVLKLEHIVLSAHEKTDTIYHDFYPHGLSEYHNIAQPNILMLMDRMVSYSGTYSADIGATWEVDFTDIRTRFTAIFANQKQMIGDVDSTTSDYEVQLGPMYNQLFKNACIIMSLTPEKPDRLLDYFDQTIANYETHVKVVALPKNANTNADISFTVNDTMQIRSKYNLPLQFFFGPTADAVPPETPSNLAANAVVEVNCSTIGLPANCFLIFINANATDGKVEVLLK